MRTKTTTVFAFMIVLVAAILIGCGGGTSGLATATAGETALYTTAGYSETGAGYTTDIKTTANSSNASVNR